MGWEAGTVEMVSMVNLNIYVLNGMSEILATYTALLDGFFWVAILIAGYRGAFCLAE